MNSQIIYDQIIARAANRTLADGAYYERHHIKPRSMGGSDAAENIAVLTAREHYICHWLLYKIHRNSQMATAWFFMQYHSSGMRYVSRTFAYARKYNALHMTGRSLTEDHKRKISESGKGRMTTESQSAAISAANKSRAWTDQMRKNASDARAGVFTRGKHQRAVRVCILESGQEFDCMTDAADFLGVTKAAIQNSITRNGKCKGFTIKKIK